MTPVQPATKPKAVAAKLLVIDVAGAVRHPGLYQLRAGSRIDDAIALAGGATAKAQLDTVNLAAPSQTESRSSFPGEVRATLRRRALRPPAPRRQPRST